MTHSREPGAKGPSHDPEFGATIDHPVWYLAHPLTATAEYGFDENMQHVLKVARLLTDAGLRVIVPWHTLCLFMDDDNREHRRIGLEIDCYVAAMLGRIILSGDRCSGGMQKERDAVYRVGGLVLDLVGVPDTQLVEVASSIAIQYA